MRRHCPKGQKHTPTAPPPGAPFFKVLNLKEGVITFFFLAIFFCNLLLPLTMVGFGWAFAYHPPRGVNNWYGYHTKATKRSAATWQFAHAQLGRLWLRLGPVLFAMSVLVQLPFVGAEENTIAVLAVVLETVQLTALLLCLIPVEKALKRNFDENGTPR